MRKRFKKIYIEITNICNLHCDFCPKTKRALSFMPYSLCTKAILESKDLAEEITLHIMGEPLLHPDIEKIILFAQEHDVRINLTTNGTLVAQHIQLLLTPAIRRINFSVHGLQVNYTKEEQQKILSEIIAFTKLAQEERDDLIIIYRLWNIENQSNAFVLNQIAQEFNVQLEEGTKKTSMKIKHNAYIHYDYSFVWPNPKHEIRTQKGYCHGLSTHIGILVDGTVVPCCLDNDGTIPLGTITEKKLVDILSDSRAVLMKKGFQERKLVESLCTKCTYIKRLERNRDLV